MPKAGRTDKQLQAKLNKQWTVDDWIDYDDVRITNVLQEAAHKISGGFGEDHAKKALAYLKHAGKALPTSYTSCDPGPFLEIMWRTSVRIAAPGAAVLYDDAVQTRSFCDSGPPPRMRPDMLINNAADSQMMDEALSASHGGSQEATNSSNDSTVDPGDAVLADTFGDCSEVDRWRYMLQHLHVASNIRPHGFSSVGKVSVDSDLGKILMHGLQLFMEITWNEEFKQNLHERHKDAAAIFHPQVERSRFVAHYEGSRYTTVPPAGAMVPVFDHLSVPNQMLFVSQVVEELLVIKKQGGDKDPSSSVHGPSLPPDNVFCWAAFNKLVGMGMMATMEEAAAAAAPGSSSSSTGVTLGAAAAAADLQELAAARKAESVAAIPLLAAAVSRLRVSLHNMIQQQQHLGAAALEHLAAVQHKQELQGLQQLVSNLSHKHHPRLKQQSDHGNNSGGSSSSSSSSSKQQQQHEILLHVCTSVAWPLRSLDALLRQVVPEPGANKDQAAKEKWNFLREHCRSTSSSDVLQAAVDCQAAAAAAQLDDEQMEQVLLQQLSQLLLPTCKQQQQQQADGAAAAAVSNDAAAEMPGLEAQGFLSTAISILLQKALAKMPPAESVAWSENNSYVELLQLLLDAERLKSATATLSMLKFSDGLLATLPDEHILKACGSEQQRHQQQHQQQLWQNCIPLLCSVFMRLRRLAEIADESSSNSDMHKRQQQWRPYSSTPPPPPAAAAAAASLTSWRTIAVSLYKAVRPSGWTWLEKNFTNAAADNAQPGFWGLIRCFLSADLLNLHHRLDPESASAANSMWLYPGLETPYVEPCAWFSKQAARVADKALGVALCRQQQQQQQHPGAPLPTQTLQQLLRLACLAGEAAVVPLPYVDLTPAAAAAHRKAAAAAAAAASKLHTRTNDVECAANENELATVQEAADQDAGDIFVDAGSGSGSDDDDEFVSPTMSGLAPAPLGAAAAAVGELDAALQGLFNASSAATAPGPVPGEENAAKASIASSSAAAATAAATAAAAAARWQGPALHVGEFNSLGPMFDEQQQGPCLARMMELIAEYYQQHAQAAAAAATSADGVKNITESSSSSSSSRLMTLLLGLYHMHMLQLQRQQQQEHDLYTRPAAAAAAAAARSSPASVYTDFNKKLSACNAAVVAAQEMLDLFLYCATPDWASSSNTSSSESSSSSSSSSQNSVGSLVNKLARDYLHLLLLGADDPLAHHQQRDQNTKQQQRQQQQHGVNCSMVGLPTTNALHILRFNAANPDERIEGLSQPNRCDSCSIVTKQQDIPSCTVFSVNGHGHRPKNLGICGACGAAVLCEKCFNDKAVGAVHRNQHCKLLQQLWQQQVAAAAAAAAVGRGVAAVGKASGMRSSRLRRPAPAAATQVSDADVVKWAACRCADCKAEKFMRINFLNYRQWFRPLHLMLLPLQQQQQQHGDLFDRWEQQDDKVQEEVRRQILPFIIQLYFKSNQLRARDEHLWRQRRKQQQQQHKQRVNKHSGVDKDATSSSSSSSRASRGPAADAYGDHASSSSSMCGGFGAGVPGPALEQQQQQWCWQQWQRSHRPETHGAGLSDEVLFGGDYDRLNDVD